jgi:signal transduction histidine kinase
MNESIHGERTASELQDRVIELIEQQTAISEVLRAIANSPHDLQPIFDAILDSATHLCRADIGALRLSEESGLRRVALRGDPLLVSQACSSIPVLAEKGNLVSRLAASRLPTHIPDITALEADLRDDFWITLVNAGFRTSLAVPLLKDSEIVGIITLGRKQVQPFTDKQISLFRDFAAQATIALESTRRERQYREAQLALAHANRIATMGQLTASIAHEVKQPLTAAAAGKAGLNWLTRSAPEIEEAKESVESSRKAIDRAIQIIERIHQLVKKTSPEKQRLDVNETIVEVIELVHGEILKNGVVVRTELADCLPPIQGDRVQLQQVILNLLVNAIQAMSNVSDGTRELAVTTGVVKSGGAVHVTVRDSGPGLSPENLSRLFEPFYTTKPEGMGMGLSICRSIIEAHGGRLWTIRCEPQCALFQFTIPAT